MGLEINVLVPYEKAQELGDEIKESQISKRNL